MIDQIKEILMELLDIDGASVLPGSYLVRDLGVESIDFLELAVSLNERFQVIVEDDTLFLRNLRYHLESAHKAGVPSAEYLKSQYAFLPPERIEEILCDLDYGPVIQVRDLLSYVQWQKKSCLAA